MARLRKKTIRKIMNVENALEVLKKIEAATNPKFRTISITPKKDIISVQNRKVMDVSEYSEISNIQFGNYKAWFGSTETEYFSIIFVRAILTISIAEREMELGKKTINYAILTKLYNNLDNKSKEQAESDFIKYNMYGYKEDLKHVTFDDIMTVLKWTYYSDKVKIKEGMILDA